MDDSGAGDWNVIGRLWFLALGKKEKIKVFAEMS